MNRAGLMWLGWVVIWATGAAGYKVIPCVGPQANETICVQPQPAPERREIFRTKDQAETFARVLAVTGAQGIRVEKEVKAK